MNSPDIRFPTQAFLQLMNLFQPSRVRYNRRVFCNRNLRMEKIEAIGLDMDYTLAVYKIEFDQLAFDLTCQRLVERYQFPREMLGFRYDPEFAIRGLVIDMRNGNIFKMDRHRHVSRAFHGTRRLGSERRVELYRKNLIHLSRPQYFLVDTLFSLPETHLYAQTVDLLDSLGQGSADNYESYYRAIRRVVDEIHQDGTLKQAVLRDLPRYVERDNDIAYTLERFIDAGKKIFLVTNSDWDYSDPMMSFLLDDVIPGTHRWTDYFHTIIVSANKPRFFTQTTPLVPEKDAKESDAGKVFRGGSLRKLEERLQTAGDKVLYIGDHIYGDMLKSKRASTWRTTMVIPEMETELDNMESVREEFLKLDRFFQRRQDLNVELNYQQRLLLSLVQLQDMASANGDYRNPIPELAQVSEKNVAETRRALRMAERGYQETMKIVHAPFNPRWGMLFQESSVHSVLGAQVEQYACTYTSRFSDFLAYSPVHYFRTPRDVLPHEREG